MEKEIWKAIREYELLYEVSNYGRVRRLEGMVLNKKGGLTKVAGRVLTIIVDSGGYLAVTLTKDGKRKRKLIHRLVAETFIPNPLNKPIVNHKDRSRRNPHIGNLEWATHSENTLDSIKNKNNQKKANNEFETVIPLYALEIWRDIPAYGNYYQVSNFGNIKRMKTVTKTKKGHFQTTNEHFMTPFLYKNNGYAVKLTKQSKSKTLYVHRIVALAFLPNPENKPFVKHIDENISNNIVYNLKWSTSREISSLIFDKSFI